MLSTTAHVTPTVLVSFCGATYMQYDYEVGNTWVCVLLVLCHKVSLEAQLSSVNKAAATSVQGLFLRLPQFKVIGILQLSIFL
jgi:hypothetical protein